MSNPYTKGAAVLDVSSSASAGVLPGSVLDADITGNAATVTGLYVAPTKLLSSLNTITFAGTDGTTMTFPATSATLARTDAANTFTGVQTFSSTINANGNISQIGGIFIASHTVQNMFQFTRYVNTTIGPQVTMIHSRGAAIGDHGTLINNDQIGNFSFNGDNGTTNISAVSFHADVDGVPTGGPIDMPGAFVIATRPPGAVSNIPIDRWRVNSFGDIGTVSGSKRFWDGLGCLGDTYTVESVPNVLDTYVGGVNVLEQTPTTTTITGNVVTTGDLSVADRLDVGGEFSASDLTVSTINGNLLKNSGAVILVAGKATVTGVKGLRDNTQIFLTRQGTTVHASPYSKPLASFGFHQNKHSNKLATMIRVPSSYTTSLAVATDWMFEAQATYGLGSPFVLSVMEKNVPKQQFSIASSDASDVSSVGWAVI